MVQTVGMHSKGSCIVPSDAQCCSRCWHDKLGWPNSFSLSLSIIDKFYILQPLHQTGNVPTSISRLVHRAWADTCTCIGEASETLHHRNDHYYDRRQHTFTVHVNKAFFFLVIYMYSMYICIKSEYFHQLKKDALFLSKPIVVHFANIIRINQF